MIRKSLVLLTVFAFVFGMAGVALAANRVEVKVTSEPIPLDSECSKAGGFSIEFDEGTTLTVGDQITVDTDFGTTICRSFDIMIAPVGDIQLLADGTYDVGNPGTLWAQGNTQLTGQAAFTQTSVNTISAVSTGVVFRLRGTAGTQRISLDVLGPAGNFIEVTDADPGQPDVVTLNFLGETTNPIGGPNPEGPAQWNFDSLWEVGTTARLYNDDADWDDNTLCIDISSDLFTKTVVNASMDSRADKFTFIPSNPQIAHVAQPLRVELFACKVAADPDNIIIPDEQGSCRFDYESGTGYCASLTPGRNPDLGRRVVFNNLGGFYDTADAYSVRLDILSPGDGVYWSGEAVGIDAQATADCATANDTTLGVRRAYNRSGSPLTTFTGDSGTCTVADAQRATTIETTNTDDVAYVLPNDTRAIGINLPALVFDRDLIEASDTVTVRVTLQTFPCGTIHSEEITLGVFGCDETPAGGGNNTMVYPYFTQLDSAIGGWWNGIVVTNLSSTDGTATFNLYESDGDQATLQQAVGGNTTFVTLLEPTLDAMTMVESPDGTLGNSPCYIVVCTDFRADGFAMIANNSDSDVNGSESMGYLPRVDRALTVCNP